MGYFFEESILMLNLYLKKYASKNKCILIFKTTNFRCFSCASREYVDLLRASDSLKEIE